MRTSEQTDKIAAALARAQLTLRNPEKNKVATIPMKSGGKYSYNYADLPNIIDTIREPFASNELSHSSGTVYDAGKLQLSVRLSHSSGQWYESTLALPFDGDPKSLAANLTYFRRYLLQGLTGVAADDDLDSEPEENAKYEDRRPAPQAPKPQPVVKAATPQMTVKGSEITSADRDMILNLSVRQGYSTQEVATLMQTMFKKKKILELTRAEFQELHDLLLLPNPGNATSSDDFANTPTGVQG